jgi:HPt (histidine-containing phosphotransfer) domain-containing protein
MTFSPPTTPADPSPRSRPPAGAPCAPQLAEIAPHLDDLAEQIDAEVVATLVDMFLDRTPPLLGEVRAAVIAGDSAALVSSSHALKSSAASLGAMTASKLCGELELFGRGVGGRAPADVFRELEAAIQGAMGAMVIYKQRAT